MGNPVVNNMLISNWFDISLLQNGKLTMNIQTHKNKKLMYNSYEMISMDPWIYRVQTYIPTNRCHYFHRTVRSTIMWVTYTASGSRLFICNGTLTKHTTIFKTSFTTESSDPAVLAQTFKILSVLCKTFLTYSMFTFKTWCTPMIYV